MKEMAGKFDKIEKAVNARHGENPYPKGKNGREFRVELRLPPGIRPYSEEGLPQVLQVQRREAKKAVYHGFADCPLQRSANWCAPISDEFHDTLRALTLSTVFQEAVDAGAEAFANAVSQHGPPAELVAGGETGGSDISAHGDRNGEIYICN
ncbi:hypothetical protein CYMTET_5749 [Cymbomonas tetramitiformis]|uniref:Uncharacterized protein n=1 Tax=Cymbomonas tetramitiformis TaxID=36881 RepID=A0AAE0GZ03_9CHLO|nr:hypothetical protein CYMTET_5749 [Cymbomonas tetramitiformis]